MPRAEIATKQAKYALEKLHAELGGKIIDNKKEATRLAQAMLHVESRPEDARARLQRPLDLREASQAKPLVQEGHRIPSRP